MHSKPAALGLLVKHVGVSPDRLQLSGTVGAEGTQRSEIVVVDPASGSDDAAQVERLRQRAGAERAASPADGNDHGSEDLDDDIDD